MYKALVILALFLAIAGGATYFSYDLFIRPRQELEDEQAFGTPPPPPDASLPELEKCLQLKRENKILEARTAFETFLNNYPSSTKLEDAKDALGDLNVDIFLSATPSPEKEEYVIQAGDALAKIERKLKVRSELIMRSNNLEDPRRLSIGQVLYVSHPQFALVINRKQRKVTLYNHGKFFKQYRAKDWTVTPPKTNAPITTKVTDLAAYQGKERVAFGTKEYLGAAHWVQFGAQSYTLYTQGGDKPKEGIALGDTEMEELSALLTRGVPVTIE